MKKYQAPSFLVQLVAQLDYEKWLSRKAKAHCKRDRDRGNIDISVSEYKEAIHKAVCECNGYDMYTGEALDWQLLSKWNNDDAKKGKRESKKSFGLLPSIDHVGDGSGKADFKICSWKTNDAKNDLTYSEFVTLCKKIISFYELDER